MRRDRLGVLLLLFGASQLVLGLTMAFAPGFFFDDVGPYAPRNDHYIRDVATLYLALGGVALVAWRRASWRVPVLAFALAQYVLHAVNHLVDVNGADPKALGPANLASLTVTAVLLAGMLWWALRAEGPG
jgi:hypothetical protein